MNNIIFENFDEKKSLQSFSHEMKEEKSSTPIEGYSSSLNVLRSESSVAIRARRGSSLDLQRDMEMNEMEYISPGERKTSTIINIRRRSTTSILPTPINPPKRKTKEEIKLDAHKMDYIEHQFDLNRLAEYFHTNIDTKNAKNSRGLTSDQAQALLKQFGPNTLTPPERMPKWELFLVQFTNYFMILLLVAGTLSIVSYAIPPHDITNVILGVLLVLVVIFTCVETFIVESQSDELMSKFRAMVPNQAVVVRDGVISMISAENLVVGDLIILKSGDKIPADCRVLHVESLKVDQSLVTGEVEPIEIDVESHDQHPLESKNLIFNGTLAVEGSGLAVVIRTGDESMIGSIVELTGETKKGSTTLKADIDKFVLLLTLISLLQAIVIFVVGVLRGISPLDAFIQGFIVIFVANVPQGLPSTITTALYIVAQRMSEKNVLVKKLDIIETLGSCSVICTDKTGTLTLNKMTIVHFWTFSDGVLPSSYFCDSKQTLELYPPSIFWLVHVACLNSRVMLQKLSDEAPFEPVGDATELGLYRYFRENIQQLTKCDIEIFRDGAPKLFEIPFNSSNKWQLSMHMVRERLVILLKGAPDVILQQCSNYLNGHGDRTLIADDFMNHFHSTIDEFGGNGERVLGFAYKEVENDSQYETRNVKIFRERLSQESLESVFGKFCFVGLITLMDPARPEVPQAVQECLSAGVKIVMVTGDHPTTAKAIARNIGVISLPTKEDIAIEKGIDPSECEDDARAAVVHGADISLMNDEQWRSILNKDQIVFARTSPEQKLIIVQKFTTAGKVVAMTGDGVNDSPALKQASIGVAMGKSGSDVAREAADLVILDDNFASIVIAIKEGRLLFSNLKKSIAYTLAHLTPEILPILLWAFIGFPLVINGVLILCIDLLTELFPAISLAYEYPESDLMNIPPRSPKKDLLVSHNLLFYSYFQIGFIHTGVCYFVLYLILDSYHLSFADFGRTQNNYFTSYPIGSYTTDGESFSVHQQKHILTIIQGSWFLMIVVGQAIHIWTCRTLTSSIFGHGFFSNMSTNIGVIVALTIAVILVYTPGIQLVVLASSPPSLIIFYGALLGIVCIIPFTEGRKLLQRNYPSTWECLLKV